MSLRDLSTPTMANILSAWLDPERERKHIETLPKAAFLLPTLEDARNAIVPFQSTAASTLPTELGALQKEAAEIDAVHDRKSRGIHGALTAFAEIVDEPDKAARYIALRERLFPQGLAVIQLSYVEEAAAAELADGRLTADDRALLKQLPFPGGRLIDAHQVRLMAARKLADLERQKQALMHKHEMKEGKVALADVAKARNGWIRAVRAFLGVLELEKEMAPEMRQKILAPLYEADHTASKRGGNEDADTSKDALSNELRPS